MSAPLPCALLGCGPAGRGVVMALSNQLHLRWACDPARAGEELAGGVVQRESGPLAGLELLLLAVPDHRLGLLVEEVARHWDEEAHSPAPTVLQLGAASPAARLSPLAERGWATGLLHPLQSFPRGEAAAVPVPCWGISGQEAARVLARRLLVGIGAEWIELDEDQRLPYHLCGVLAGNLPQALLSLAGRIWPGGDGAQARRMLAPLLSRALANTLRSSPAEALSGPLARGDRETLRRHLDWLRHEDAELGLLYEILAGELLHARGEHHRLDRVGACSAWLQGPAAEDSHTVTDP
jgi:predicted short-subunit dehydrogenase-like oxidoreductase (DUF2520 family)